MRRGSEAWFLVIVADGGVIPANDFEPCLFIDGIEGHFEHTQMEVCYGGEGATCDDD